MPVSPRSALLATALALAVPPAAAPLAAQQTILDSRGPGTTTDWTPLLGSYDYGDQPCCSGASRYYATYLVGQTFTAPSGASLLQQFSVWLGAATGSSNAPSDQLRFHAYLMAWGGTRPTGSVLWQSDVQTGSSAAVFQGSTNGTPYTFAPNVALAPGQSYVFFLGAHGQLGTAYPRQYLTDRVEVRTGSGYAGGTMVSYGGYGPRSTVSATSYYTTQNWTLGATDLGFRAVIVAVPEPATLALTGLGLAGVAAAVRRRRTRGRRGASDVV